MTPSPYHAEQNIFYDLLGQGYAGLNNFFLLGRNNFSVCAVEDKEGTCMLPRQTAVIQAIIIWTTGHAKPVAALKIRDFF